MLAVRFEGRRPPFSLPRGPLKSLCGSASGDKVDIHQHLKSNIYITIGLLFLVLNLAFKQ